MPSAEGCIRWDDPALNIDWPMKTNELILSDKDKNAERYYFKK